MGIAAAVLAVALCTPVGDAPTPDVPASVQDSGWKAKAVFYLWAFSVSGDVATSTVASEFDVSFGDAVEYLTLALPLHVEIWRKDKFGIITDVNWMQFEDEPTVLGQETDLAQTIGFVEGLLAYRLRDEEVFFDLLAGVRWTYLKTEFEGPLQDRERDRSLIDPVIGVRIGVECSDRLTVWLRADVGGFGIGTDITGNLLVGLQWQFSKVVGAMIGYRGMAMEYETEHYNVDLRLHGPFLGVDLAF